MTDKEPVNDELSLLRTEVQGKGTLEKWEQEFVPDLRAMSNTERKKRPKIGSDKLVMDFIDIDIYKNPKFRALYKNPNEQLRDAALKQVMEQDDNSFVIQIFIDAISELGFSEDRFALIRERLASLLNTHHNETIENLRGEMVCLPFIVNNCPFEMAHGQYITEDERSHAAYKRDYLLACLTIRALKLSEFYGELGICEDDLKRVESYCKDVIPL